MRTSYGTNGVALRLLTVFAVVGVIAGGTDSAGDATAIKAAVAGSLNDRAHSQELPSAAAAAAARSLGDQTSVERLRLAVFASFRVALQTSFDASLSSLQSSVLLARNAQCELNSHSLSSKLDSATALLANYSAASTANEHELAQQLTSKMCLDVASLSSLYSSPLVYNAPENRAELAELVLMQLTSPGCDLCAPAAHAHSKHEPHRLEVWFYGIMAATVLTLSTFVAALLKPLTRCRHFKHILMFLVSMAVGTLTATAILHLIPHAFGVNEDIAYSKDHMYIWRALVILVGLYLFLLVEQVLRFFMQLKQHRKSKKRVDANNTADGPMRLLAAHSLAKDEKADADEKRQADAATQQIAPVAWIIIFSEGLHYLIDGLSIGAAFTESTINGSSLTLAILCEEFPHKLGDFAILLTAGMSFKSALISNCLASSFIYAGVVLGIVVGENFNANHWIYALASGMFIYIGVCDMIPQIAQMGDEIVQESLSEERPTSPSQWHGHAHAHSHSHSHHSHAHHSHSSVNEPFSARIKLQNLLIQNGGILFGFSVMLVLSLFAEKISF